jgi:uncharacterized membrane protein
VSVKLRLSLIVVIVFHITGMIGMSGDHPSFFIRNTPFNLLLSALVLFLNHRSWTANQVLALITIFLLGFFVEVIGTNTGYLFGNYHYGKTLGLKFWNVPVVIGINWMMQVYIAGNLVEQLPVPFILKATAGAMMLVLLDYFIEPVAIHFDYWSWDAGSIPATNYFCWFIISFLFLSLFLKTRFKQYNPLSGVLYLLQLLLFIILSSGF